MIATFLLDFLMFSNLNHIIYLLTSWYISRWNHLENCLIMELVNYLDYTCLIQMLSAYFSFRQSLGKTKLYVFLCYSNLSSKNYMIIIFIYYFRKCTGLNILSIVFQSHNSKSQSNQAKGENYGQPVSKTPRLVKNCC